MFSPDTIPVQQSNIVESNQKLLGYETLLGDAVSFLQGKNCVSNMGSLSIGTTIHNIVCILDLSKKTQNTRMSEIYFNQLEKEERHSITYLIEKLYGGNTRSFNISHMVDLVVSDTTFHNAISPLLETFEIQEACRDELSKLQGVLS